MERIDQETLASMDYDNLEAFRANTLCQAPIQTALREKMIGEFEKIKAGFCPPLTGRLQMTPSPLGAVSSFCGLRSALSSIFPARRPLTLIVRASCRGKV